MLPPDPEDPLHHLIVALELAKAGQRMSRLMNAVRRVEETDEQALIRLIHERGAIVAILKRLGVNHEMFDDTYRNTNIVEELIRKVSVRIPK